DNRFDLAAVTHDARVLEQPRHVAGRETGDFVDVEIGERGAKILALGEDGSPAQARLKSLETQFLEQTSIIRHREAPLLVVIGEELRRGRTPAAALLAVGKRD